MKSFEFINSDIDDTQLSASERTFFVNCKGFLIINCLSFPNISWATQYKVFVIEIKFILQE